MSIYKVLAVLSCLHTLSRLIAVLVVNMGQGTDGVDNIVQLDTDFIVLVGHKVYEMENGLHMNDFGQRRMNTCLSVLVIDLQNVDGRVHLFINSPMVPKFHCTLKCKAKGTI